MDENLMLSAFLALGLALVFLGLDLILTGRFLALHKRIDSYSTGELGAALGEEPRAGSRGRFGASNWRRQIATELARADLPITPTEYIFANLLTAGLGLSAGYLLFQNPLLAALGGVAGLAIPRVYVRYLQRKRLEAFESELDSTLLLLSNALRSGFGLAQAMDAVAKESPPPISTEFRRVMREISLGLPIQEALDNMLRRNPSLDLDLVITAVRVTYEVGGNLSEVLDRIAGTIRERTRLAGEIRALTAQQRFSAGVLTVLPGGLLAIIYVINPVYISQLWQETCGLAMLALGGALVVIGLLFIRRILAIKY